MRIMALDFDGQWILKIEDKRDDIPQRLNIKKHSNSSGWMPQWSVHVSQIKRRHALATCRRTTNGRKWTPSSLLAQGTESHWQVGAKSTHDDYKDIQISLSNQSEKTVKKTVAPGLMKISIAPLMLTSMQPLPGAFQMQRRISFNMVKSDPAVAPLVVPTMSLMKYSTSTPILTSPNWFGWTLPFRSPSLLVGRARCRAHEKSGQPRTSL